MFKIKYYPISRQKRRKDYTDPRKKNDNSPKPKKRKVPAKKK